MFLGLAISALDFPELSEVRTKVSKVVLPTEFGFSVIYQTRETVFHLYFQTPRRELKMQRSALGEIRVLWIADETRSRSKLKLKCKQSSKIVEIYAQDWYPNLLQDCDFLFSNLLNFTGLRRIMLKSENQI